MDQELENKQDNFSSEQNETSREGYSPTQQGYNNEYHGGRTQRPRIHSQHAYSSDRNGNREDGGFRPEGFGGGLQSGGEGMSSPRPYRPRYNNSGNYQSRPYNNNYGQPRQGGYRPRFNNQEGEAGGGYQPRPNYGQPRQGGYRPRFNNPEGGYQPREGAYQPREGGYQPREGGYRPRNNYQQGGYQPRPNYGQPRQGGYNNYGGYQPRGNYQPRSYNQGGYRPRTPGYDPHAKYSMKKRIEYKEEHTDPNEPIRLNKYLANAGVCSRREADEFIQAGVVTVNGQVITELGTKIVRTDEVKFHDQPVTLEKKVYVLLNKPRDYVTTSDDPQQRKTVMELVKGACPERIYPVGRLDRNTTGVLLFTNDGDLASKLTHPKFLKKKVYHVFLDKEVTMHDMQQIATGITLDDGEIHADAIEYAKDNDKKQVGIEIHSGRNRIVRRIFESLGYRVVRLERVQISGLTKKNMRRGDWRFLTEKEVDMLRMGAFE